jgi:FAD/FMN-containing dehydrogenase/Fe-S oxidoreductase
VDDQQRQHIHDDLKGFIKGDLLFDELSRVLYSTDASIFQVQPAGVVVPRDEEDVRALVRYAAEHQVALVPRGAGTGVAGESLGAGLVIDLSRYFRDILAVDGETIRVQPGVTCRQVNQRLAAVGRRFAPDPSNDDTCTIGGMVANNASGSRILRHGYTRDHVAALRIVVDTGDVATVAQEAIQPSLPPDRPEHVHDIINASAALLEQHADLIRAHQPRTRYNRCGYLLQDVLQGDTLDLPRLLVGSEGTLALFTEITLRTIPLPGGRALVLLGFASLDAALRAVGLALLSRPAACELIDRRLLRLARGSEAGGVAALIPPAAEAVLLIEYEADSAKEAQQSAQDLVNLLYRGERLALHAETAQEPDDIERLWRLREVALPTLYGLSGPTPVSSVEDVGVPPEELATYLHRVQELLHEQELTASFLIHAGSGQVHMRPFLDLAKPDHVAKLAFLSEKVHALALEVGGTVSTQHGTGLARTAWVGRQYKELYPVFRQLKAIFDPRNLFNPGKIVDPDPMAAAWPLRIQPLVSPDPETWLLRWQPGEVQAEIARCNGCGECRLTTPVQRMCPIFRATHAEAATPRAKANLLRNLLPPALDARQLSSDRVRAVADLCVNCRMCATECPARVNIPKLMLEAKAANVTEHGLHWKDWFLARTEGFARWGSRFAPLVNLALGSMTGRWFMARLFGLAQQRRMPRFAPRSFLSLARRRGWSRRRRSNRPRVAYFVDVYPNYVDPQIGEALVAVLGHHGIDVYVPSDQVGCGMAALAYGDVETAREATLRNVRAFAELAREGTTIVCSEPTAALMLRQDYLDLLDDSDARLVAENTVELTGYLMSLHARGQLRTDFQPLDVALGHHIPCHLKALGQPPAGPALLSLIPSLRVHTIDVSCSGMAGTFGLHAAHYQTSLEAGAPMIEELQRPRVLLGSTECSTCRLQMEDAGGTRTLHPVQYLALAYGLMPSLARRLKEPIGDLIL